MNEILNKHRARLVLVFLALLLEMTFNAMVPLSLRYIIDDGLSPHNYRAVLLIVAALGGGAIVVSATGLGRDYLNSRSQSSILADIRELMFHHLQRLSIATHSRLEVGDVLSRFSNDLTAVENAMSMAVPWGVLPGMEAILSSILLMVLDWRLGFIAMLLWPWTALVPRSVSRKASDASHVRKEDETRLLSRVAENLSAQPVVKAFNLQPIAILRFRELNSTVTRSSTRAGFYSSLMERSTTSGILIIQVAVLGVSGYLAFHGAISIGTLVSFQGLLLMLSNSLLYVMQYAPSLVLANASWTRIQQLLNEAPGVEDPPKAIRLPVFRQAIEFDNVEFSYDGSQPNLSRVAIRIPSGWKAAFVGGSGSGKSTALSMLMRFYDPVGGTVRVDGMPINQVTQESLRSQMGVVFQESFLFNTSIRENIRAGKRGASDAEIEEAAKAAEIHDAIMAMPEKYETVVGEMGHRLSGGQRQRIAIARAMVKNPQILLLDEATSALDPATEAQINDTLRRLGRGRTVISVTHRLASITDADGIFVFSSGQMIECGRHHELVNQGGAYAKLWEKQAGFSFGADGSHVSVSSHRLRAIPLLADLAPELLSDVARLCVTHSFRANDEVFRQGDPGDTFYLVVRGRFQVVQNGQVVAMVEDGDCFGEIALVTPFPRNATIRAVIPSTCLTLDRAHFQELLANSPTTQERINELVRRRLADIAEQS